MSTIRKQHFFATIPEKLIFDSSISCGARTLYAILDRHADRDGEAYPGMIRIASILGVSVDTARLYRNELEASGWLLNQGQSRDSGCLNTNRYLLIQVRDCDLDADTEKAVHGKSRNGLPPSREVPGTNDSPFSNESQKGNESISSANGHPARFQLVAHTPERPTQQPTSSRPDDAQSLISELNTLVGRTYTATKDRTATIKARLQEVDGDVAGVRVMLARQVALWGSDEKMAQYLTPDTLFRKSKFIRYYEERNLPVETGKCRNPEPHHIRENITPKVFTP